MEGVPKRRYLSVKQQQILWKIYSEKILTFSNQDIYRDRKSFKSSLKHLEKTGLIKKKPVLENESFETGYFLTFNGLLVVEEFLWYL